MDSPQRIVGLKFSEPTPDQLRRKGPDSCLNSDAFCSSITLHQIKGAKVGITFQRPNGRDTQWLQQQIAIGFLPHPFNGSKRLVQLGMEWRRAGMIRESNDPDGK